MRVLFDHNVPYNLKAFLHRHSVSTSAEMGWSELMNGKLIGAAEQNGFDVFVTCDQDIFYQQNILSRRIAIVEISKNNWPSVEPAVAAYRLRSTPLSPTPTKRLSAPTYIALGGEPHDRRVARLTWNWITMISQHKLAITQFGLSSPIKLNLHLSGTFQTR